MRKNKIKKIGELLLKLGAPIDGKNNRGRNAYHDAIEQNQKKALKFLIEHKASINEKTTPEGFTPLHLAAGNSDKVTILKSLISNGALINEKDNTGYTPLHIAAIYSKLKNVKFLLKNGALINELTLIGDSALNLALKNKAPAIALHLINAGANINLPNKAGKTPLHLATKKNYIDIVKDLIELNATIHATTIKGHTPAHIAQTIGSLEIIKLLAENGETFQKWDYDTDFPKGVEISLYVSFVDDLHCVSNKTLSFKKFVKRHLNEHNAKENLKRINRLLLYVTPRAFSLLKKWNIKQKLNNQPLHIPPQNPFAAYKTLYKDKIKNGF